jgi:trimeric autotransporter adhesin
MNANIGQAAINSMASSVESIIKSSQGGNQNAQQLKAMDSGVLKDLVSELCKDCKLDQSDVNILKLFLDLIKQLSGGEGGANAAKPSAEAAPGAPAASAGGGSQAPPASAAKGATPATPATPAAPNKADAAATAPGDAKAADASPAAPKTEAKAAEKTAKAEGKDATETKGDSNADTKADKVVALKPLAKALKEIVDTAVKDGDVDKNELNAIAKLVEKVAAPAEAESKVAAASPASAAPAATSAAPAATSAAPTATSAAPTATSAAPTATSAAPTATSAAPTSGNPMQGTYDALKRTALADGNISPTERGALNAAAAKFGINDADMAAPSKTLGAALKDVVSTAMSDGRIDENESQAINALASRMGGKADGLSQGDVLKMLTDVMAGTSADGKFSDQDLSTFKSVLNLADGNAGGGSASGAGGAGAGGGAATPNASRERGVTAKSMADYLFSPFMGAKNMEAIQGALNASASAAGGQAIGSGIDGIKREEDKEKASGSSGA